MPRLSKNWITTSALAESLGCSRRHLLNLKKQGVFKEGTHFRNINPTAARPSYRWNIKKIEEKLSERGF